MMLSYQDIEDSKVPFFTLVHSEKIGSMRKELFYSVD